MDKNTRHQKTWRLLYRPVSWYIKWKFNMEHEDLCPEGPCIVIPNHVSEWDPLLVAMSFPKKQMYFVASEHLFRKGLVTKLLNFLVAPIARKKASSGSDTVKAILRQLKAGHSVCLFAEGEASWNGLSGKVPPATGKLVRASGASLVTYVLEGGYLSDPRWGKGVRKGRLRGHPVRVYSPEELKAMKAEEVTAAIERDISEDAWQRQKQWHSEYRGKNPAEFMETALFICPDCGRMDGLKGRGDMIRCSCGFERRYEATGLFSPPVPFENIAQWDMWQHEKLKSMQFQPGKEFFSDGDMCLSKIGVEHGETLLGRGRISQSQDCLCCAGVDFDMERIQQMAMVQANVLLFSYEDEYFQIKAEKSACLRKYLAIWNDRKTGGK